MTPFVFAKVLETSVNIYLKIRRNIQEDFRRQQWSCETNIYRVNTLASWSKYLCSNLVQTVVLWWYVIWGRYWTIWEPWRCSLSWSLRRWFTGHGCRPEKNILHFLAALPSRYVMPKMCLARQGKTRRSRTCMADLWIIIIMSYSSSVLA
jgi:hypothetical protein